MDVELVKQYRALKKEKENLKKQIDRISKDLQKMEKKSVSDKVRGGVAGMKTYTVDGVRDREYSTKKTTMQQSKMRMIFLEDQLERMLGDVETYIAEIPDAERRMIFRLHYQHGLSWGKVARELGEGYTPDAVRISATRFLQAEANKDPQEYKLFVLFALNVV